MRIKEMIFNVDYELEYFNEDIDEYQLIPLSCDVNIYPAEPDVGIMSDYAEIENCLDQDGNDWYDALHSMDIEKIEEKAFECGYNGEE